MKGGDLGIQKGHGKGRERGSEGVKERGR